MKKVSIIIPIYNSEDYLLKCIRSIQRQSLWDIEIICVDDGSTDNSLAILKELGKEDDRIQIIEQQNQGSASARNHALNKAKGEYVAFVDSDDFLMDETALEWMYNTAQKQNVNICGSFRSMEHEGRIRSMNMHREFVKGYVNGRKMLYRDYQYDYHFQSYIYKRSMLIEKNIFFPDYKRFQDPPFFVQAMLESVEFWVVPVEYYCYHCEHENYQFDSKKVNDIVRGLIDILIISRTAELKRLHLTSIERLNESFFWDIVEHCTTNNVELLSLLLQAQELIQWEWVGEYCSSLKILKPIQWIMQAAEKRALLQKEYFDAKHRYGYVVPFYKLQPNKRIIILAAGNVGMAYYAQLKQHKEYDIVLWADRNWKQLGTVNGVVIQSIERILEVECDYILIALDDYEAAREAMEGLEKMKVDRRKMIWGAL